MKIKYIIIALAMLMLAPVTRAEVLRHEFKFFDSGTVIKLPVLLDFYDNNKVCLLFTLFDESEGVYIPLVNGTVNGDRLVFTDFGSESGENKLVAKVEQKEPLTLSLVEPQKLFYVLPPDRKVVMQPFDITFSDAMAGTTWEAVSLAQIDNEEDGSAKYVKVLNRLAFTDRHACRVIADGKTEERGSNYVFDGKRLFCVDYAQMLTYDAAARTLTDESSKVIFRDRPVSAAQIGTFAPEDLLFEFENYRELKVKNLYTGSPYNLYFATKTETFGDVSFTQGVLVDKEGTILMDPYNSCSNVFDAIVTQGGFLLVVGEHSVLKGKILYGGEGDLCRMITDFGYEDIRLDKDGVVFKDEGKTWKMSYLDVYNKLYEPRLSSSGEDEEAVPLIDNEYFDKEP